MGFARPHSRPTATGLTRPPDRLYFVPKSKRKKLGPDAHNVRRLLAAAYSVPVPDRLGRTGLTAAYIGDLSRSWTWHRGSAARIRLRILSGGDSGQFLGQLRSTKCRRRPDYGAGTAGCRRLLGWSGCVLTRRPKTRLRLNTDRVDRVVARRRRDFTGVYNTDVLLLCYVEVSAGIRRRTLSGIEIQKRGSDSRSVVDGPAIGKIVVGDEPEGSEITTPSGLHHGVVDVEIDAPAVGSDSVRSSPFLSVEQRRDILLKYRKLTCARRKQIQEKEPERTTPVEDKVVRRRMSTGSGTTSGGTR
ncbi:hypothetical protein LSH36_350g00037 [Paralvinella palmiformis]|uniref:Uncharacterized protein n=1 Tax=Paralvinella palmiformis TaxID=53620 RepID=A0AAD9N1P6_9ANNE|nr:hypothetical protein LSH36_350g00037 [Paralvinella palmiformis]